MNMRERLSRAISIHTTDTRWSPEGLADAVLDELMTPTEGMVEAFDSDFPAWLSEEIEDHMHLYTAMIKAAKEGK